MQNELLAKLGTKISLRIALAVQNGMDIEEAFDFVLGEGAFRKLANEIHDEFNKVS